MASGAQDSGLQLDALSGLSECRPVNITWSGGVPPYALSIGMISPVSGESRQAYLDLMTNSFEWLVDASAGSHIAVRISDATTATDLSRPLDVSTGSPSCLLASVDRTNSMVILNRRDTVGQRSLPNSFTIAGIGIAIVTVLIAIVALGVCLQDMWRRRSARTGLSSVPRNDDESLRPLAGGLKMPQRSDLAGESPGVTTTYEQV